MTGYHHPSHRLGSSDAHRAYYDERAATYDDDFACALDYVLPQRVADVFLDRAERRDDPVVDVGCGTGLLGRALLGSGHTVDGYDISPRMLDRARETGGYRDLVPADLSQPLDRPAGYGALVSSGTFTVGHLGPDALPAVLALVRPGGLCVLSVNEKHYLAEGFEAAFAKLAGSAAIGPVEYRRTCMYASPETPDDPVCWARIATFRVRA